jgi:hypothetical protein
MEFGAMLVRTGGAALRQGRASHRGGMLLASTKTNNRMQRGAIVRQVMPNISHIVENANPCVLNEFIRSR